MGLTLDGAGPGTKGGVLGFGDAEVDELHDSCPREHQILRAHVPVDQPQGLLIIVGELVRSLKTVTGLGNDLTGHGERDRGPEQTRFAAHRSQTHAVDVLHGDEEAALVLVHVENLDDVGVMHLGGETSFLEEHFDKPELITQVGQDALDHDHAGEAPDSALAGEEELRHSTCRETGEELVLAQSRRVFARHLGLVRSCHRPLSGSKLAGIPQSDRDLAFFREAAGFMRGQSWKV